MLQIWLTLMKGPLRFWFAFPKEWHMIFVTRFIGNRIGTFRWHKLMYLQRVHYGSELRFSGFSLILKVSGKERRRSLCYWFLFCLPSHHSWCQSPWGFDTLPLFTGIKFDNYFYYTTLLIFGWKGSPFQEGQWLSGGRGGFFKKWVFRGYKKAKVTMAKVAL